MTFRTPKEIVGSNLKKIRLSKGLSSAKLALLISYSQQHVSRIERGLVKLNLEQISHISKCLNVDIYELLDGVGFEYNQCVSDIFFRENKVTLYNY